MPPKKSWSTLFGNTFLNLGKFLFLTTFWLNAGFYLGGDAFYLGFFNTYQEIVFPLCGFGLFAAAFGAIIAKKDISLKIGHLLCIFIVLLLLTINAFFSWQPEISILYILLFLCGYQVLITKDEWSLFSPDVRYLWHIGTIAGLIATYFIPEKVSSLSLEMSFLILFIGWLRDTSKTTAQKTLRLLFCIAGLALLKSMVALFIILAIILVGNPWISRAEKRRKEIFIIPLIFTLVVLIWGTLSQWFSFQFPPYFGEGYLLSWKQILVGHGIGQYFISMSNLSPYILQPRDYLFPTWGFMVWFWELGILGFFIFLLSFVLRVSFFSRYKHIFPIIIWIWGAFHSEIFYSENAFLFWFFAVMNPSLFKKINSEAPKKSQN